jgi:hypothetical protein
MIGALDVTACKSEGERNAALFWSARQFGGMIGEGLIDWEPARGLLELAAVKCRLDREGMSQVRATIESGLRRGYDDFTKRTEEDCPVRSMFEL